MGKFKDFFAAVNYTNPQIMLTISFYCKLILCITIKFMKNNNQWEIFVCIWAELFEAGLSLNLVKYHGNLQILITLTQDYLST